jgi:hypothetical protein
MQKSRLTHGMTHRKEQTKSALLRSTVPIGMNPTWHHHCRPALTFEPGTQSPFTIGHPFRTMNDTTQEADMLRNSVLAIFLLTITAPSWLSASQASATGKNDGGATVLTAAEAAKILPNAVFFRGQSAPIQARNSGGIQFGKDAFLLVSLVDNSGYSSSVQEKYQAYLITETAIDIEGHRLEPGAYGCGFLSANNFIVMDIGGHDLFSVRSSRDADLRRPTPLQVLQSPGGSGFRLYVGRDFVNFAQSTSADGSHHP